MVLSITAAILGMIYYLLVHYTVKSVIVEGNKHYTVNEIKHFVVQGPLGDNSLYLAMKYKDMDIKDIPFIDTLDVNVVSNDTIRISVYEKALAGYIEYLGRYLYFDNNGTIVEAAKFPTEGIPMVCGLTFDHVVLYEKLPVSDDDIFKDILKITKLLNKYHVLCQKIYFDSNYNMTLGYGKLKVYLGKSEDLDEKIMQLPFILPELEGESGMLDLQNYTEDRNTITFQRDDDSR